MLPLNLSINSTKSSLKQALWATGIVNDRLHSEIMGIKRMLLLDYIKPDRFKNIFRKKFHFGWNSEKSISFKKRKGVPSRHDPILTKYKPVWTGFSLSFLKQLASHLLCPGNHISSFILFFLVLTSSLCWYKYTCF